LTGSAVTYFAYGGMYYARFVYNLLLFPTVKEVWKSVRFWQSYCHCWWSAFLGQRWRTNDYPKVLKV